jgi:hypothetical protein
LYFALTDTLFGHGIGWLIKYAKQL